jgi:eukaryotic-like serine/threonine-protein kinase
VPYDVYQFGPYRLDTRRRNLWRGEQLVPLSGRGFETLSAIASRLGSPVDKYELLREIWPENSRIHESNVTTQVRALRKLLGKDGSGQDYIRNIAGQGYFIPAVKRIQLDDLGSQTSSPDASSVGIGRFRLTSTWLIGATSVAVVLLSLFLIWRSYKPRTVRLSVAVLPFQAHPDNPEARSWSALLSEMIRTELGASKNLRIISGEDITRAVVNLQLPNEDGLRKETLTRIHNFLDNDYVVVGSLTRLDQPSQIRLDIKWEDTRTGEILGSESASGSEASVFDLVARCGAQLRMRFGLNEPPPGDIAVLRTGFPTNLDAARSYVEGLARLRAFDPLKARDDLEISAKLDPNSAVIHAALAEAWSALGYEVRAKLASKRAFELSHHLSRENQLSIEGRYREFASEWVRAVEVNYALSTYYPDDVEYRLRLARSQIAGGKAHEVPATIIEMRRLPAPYRDDPRIDMVEAEVSENRGDFQKELEAAQSAIQKAQRRGNRWLVARAQLKACWALDYLGQREKAQHLAEGAGRVLEELGDKGGAALATKNIADVLDDGGNHASAIPVYEKAIAEFREVGSQTGIAVTLSNMAYALKDLGDLNQAKLRFEDSARICREIGDKGREAQALNGSAGVLWRQGQLSDAQKTYEEALTRFHESDQQDRAATVVNNLAGVLQDQGRLMEAQKRFEEALAIAKDKRDQTAIARTEGNLGELFLLRGELIEAQKSFEQQLAIGTQIREDKQRAYALFGLGRLSWQRDDVEQADKLLQQALDLRKNASEKDLVLETSLAQVDIAAAHPSESVISKARTLAEQFRREQRFDQQVLADAVLIHAATDIQPADIRLAGIAASEVKQLLPNIQDYSVRLSARAALARYQAATGHRHIAAEQLRSVIQDAALGGYAIHELETTVLLAKLESSPSERMRLSEEVYRKSSIKGLFRISREVKTLPVGPSPHVVASAPIPSIKSEDAKIH